jgi:hypothetical protein
LGDVAIATGIWKVTGTFEGHDISGTYRYTRIGPLPRKLSLHNRRGIERAALYLGCAHGAWHGLRFGNLEPVDDGAIERYAIAGALYDIGLSKDGLQVKRNGKQLFAANGPVELRHVRFSPGRVSFEVRCNCPVDVHVGSGPSRRFKTGVSPASGAI